MSTRITIKLSVLKEILESSNMEDTDLAYLTIEDAPDGVKYQLSDKHPVTIIGCSFDLNGRIKPI